MNIQFSVKTVCCCCDLELYYLEQGFASLVHHFNPLLHHGNVAVRVRAEHLHEVVVADGGIIVRICDGDSLLYNDEKTGYN